MTHTVTVGAARIPIVGLGTWTLKGKECARLVEQAIVAGYRHIDTAQLYDNETEVGEGVRASGLREQVFLTTKVRPENLHAKDLERTAKESVARIGVKQVDLLLIHWPNAEIPLAETISALNKVKKDGLTKHIGVSNFNVALIEQAAKLSETRLVCNQVEYHPFLDQTKVVAACKKHDMAVVAYSPIARGGAQGDQVIARIAKAHGKSPAQISLRWLVQQGVVVIPRTSKPERLKENIALFDFELTAAEMKEIAGLARGGRIVNWTYAPKWD